jgi:hypothetical protein
MTPRRMTLRIRSSHAFGVQQHDALIEVQAYKTHFKGVYLKAARGPLRLTTFE